MKSVALSLFLAGAIGVLCLSACATQPKSAGTLQERRHTENLATAERLGVAVRNVDGQSKFCWSGQLTGSHITKNCVSELEFESMVFDVASFCTADSAKTYFCGANDVYTVEVH